MWNVEETEIGRIVVPPSMPDRFALFYTTIDFEGRLTAGVAERLTRLLRDRFGIDAALSTCAQVHGKSVERASPGADWRECNSCDALWSSDAGSALGIKVADCLPVTIAEMEHGVVANIHSGWRGAVQQITAGTIDLLIEKTPFASSHAHAWLGPSIRRCCFEVGEEVVDAFLGAYAQAERFVDRGAPKAHIDLPGLTAAVLVGRGFATPNIHDSGLCTRCDGSIFHSFRRDPKRGGRNLAIAAR